MYPQFKVSIAQSKRCVSCNLTTVSAFPSKVICTCLSKACSQGKGNSDYSIVIVLLICIVIMATEIIFP